MNLLSRRSIRTLSTVSGLRLDSRGKDPSQEKLKSRFRMEGRPLGRGWIFFKSTFYRLVLCRASIL